MKKPFEVGQRIYGKTFSDPLVVVDVLDHCVIVRKDVEGHLPFLLTQDQLHADQVDAAMERE